MWWLGFGGAGGGGHLAKETNLTCQALHVLLNCSMILYQLAMATASGLVGRLGMGDIKGCLPRSSLANW